ncbi:HmuY family protein [Mariniflexile litorale]|uniref:HmuY family protein n=1 Tax=Mariniflexile litorale TaxID=3045158 RepID=A0AAU7EK50_9FLAO|nr:HmuY family protein [Mariniflexile sp. KMM 9835]MDQ8213228.1 HmuY family protein [Mariniflexile sp. KMM 9835]
MTLTKKNHEHKMNTSNFANKTIKLLVLVILFAGFASCSDDDDKPLLEVESQTYSNLYAPQSGGQGSGEDISGAFTKFSFSTGQTTTSETEWDIAFRGTSIIINGGTTLGTMDEPERIGNVSGYIVNNTFENVEMVNTNLLEQDSNEGYVFSDWYTYSGQPNHLITPTPGKVLVLKTYDGKYAKMEIVSYYKDAPDNPNAFNGTERYYTFNYVYQPNDGVTTF